MNRAVFGFSVPSQLSRYASGSSWKEVLGVSACMFRQEKGWAGDGYVAHGACIHGRGEAGEGSARVVERQIFDNGQTVVLDV